PQACLHRFPIRRRGIGIRPARGGPAVPSDQRSMSGGSAQPFRMGGLAAHFPATQQYSWFYPFCYDAKIIAKPSVGNGPKDRSVPVLWYSQVTAAQPTLR